MKNDGDSYLLLIYLLDLIIFYLQLKLNLLKLMGVYLCGKNGYILILFMKDWIGLLLDLTGARFIQKLV